MTGASGGTRAPGTTGESGGTRAPGTTGGSGGTDTSGSSGASRGLLDTSVLIAAESGRPLNTSALPAETFISVVTIAELHAGVLAAADTATRARRLATLDSVAGLEPLPIDVVAAGHWATLRIRLAEEGARMNVNDLWIAAVAAANNLSIVTQDSDFDPLEAIGGPPVIRV